MKVINRSVVDSRIRPVLKMLVELEELENQLVDKYNSVKLTDNEYPQVFFITMQTKHLVQIETDDKGELCRVDIYDNKNSLMSSTVDELKRELYKNHMDSIVNE